MTGLWRWVIGSCLFGHGARVNERREDGALVLACERCGHQQPLLTTAIIQGPKSQPVKVLGQPTGKAIKERPANVTDIRERQSSR